MAKYYLGARFRIFPSQFQKNIIKENSNVSRAFYNILKEYRDRLYWYSHTPMWNGDLQKEIINDCKKHLTVKWLRKHISWMRDKYLDGYMFSRTKLNNNQAYLNFFNGLQRYPRFHAWKTHPYEWKYQSTVQRGNFKLLDSKHLKAPKLGRLTLGSTQYLDTLIGNYKFSGTVTFTKSSDGKYWVSFLMQSNTPFKKYLPLVHNDKAIGIDLNISNFLMTSTGCEIPNPKFYTKGLPELRKLQRQLSHSRNYATNHHIPYFEDEGYQEARLRVAQFSAYIKNKRTIFLDKLSLRLVQNHDLIVAENLKSKNMLRNHKLAQKISDCGWREFLTMLQNKAKLYGKKVILVNPYNTTQKCSHCGFICTHKNGYHLTLKDRKWICPICKKFHIRDVNAAINILRRGQLKLNLTIRQNIINYKRKRKPQNWRFKPGRNYDFSIEKVK